MNTKLSNERGSIVPVIASVLVVALLGVMGYMFVKNMNNGDRKANAESSTSQPTTKPQAESTDTPPMKLKTIGVTLGEYDSATNKAGDFVFSQQKYPGRENIILSDFGAVSEANSAAQRRLNPQPTYILPLGTKVHSLVDGVVVNVPKLYSNDYSIQVRTTKDSQWLYETEHVINPLVKVGDKVKAGQVIAEVSTHDLQYHPGFGMYEIGILHGGSPPTHVCPYNYLDDSIKDSVWKNLTSFHAAWEKYTGNSALYDESKYVIPGCYTLDPVEG